VIGRVLVPLSIGVVLGGATQALAQPAVSDARVRELMTQALSQQSAAAPATPLVPEARPSLDLTVDEAVTRALERNLDILVERLTPGTFDYTLASLRSLYSPLFQSTLGQQSVGQLPSSQLVGGQRVDVESTTFNFQASQGVPWGGGSLTAGWNNRRQDSSSPFNTFNPQYNSSFSVQYTQPLLRNFATDQTRQQIRITQINREISELQLQATITNTVADVRSAYWDLTAALEAVAVAERSLALADKLVEDNKVRVEVGTLAPIDVVQAEAEAATRRQGLAAARATWRTAELALKRLIVSGTDDPLWSSSLNPVDRPSRVPPAIDLEAALRRALEQRTDVQQARRQLDSNRITLGYLRNQTLPGVDLVASYGLQGIGGTRFIREGGIGSPVIETIPGGFRNAIDAITGRDYPQWNLQLLVSYPLGTSAAEARVSRGRIQSQQAEAQVRQVELDVATEVTNTALLVQSNLQRVDAATAARELAQRRLEAEESKFEVGMSTNFFVVQAQRDLVEAQLTELRALLDYAKSLVDFERVQQSGPRVSVTSVSAGG